MKTDPLISLGVLCDDGYTITLDKQYISVQNNVQEIIKDTRNKKNGMWEVPVETENHNLWQITFWPRQINQNYHSSSVKHFSVQQQKSSSRRSKTFSWRLGQASQKISSRNILKNQRKQQWYTCIS